MNLRSQLIRLASQKPHLRKHLLPLLGETPSPLSQRRTAGRGLRRSAGNSLLQKGIAHALWAMAAADAVEQAIQDDLIDRSESPRGDILDWAPLPIPQEAMAEAAKLIKAIESASKMSIDEFIDATPDASDDVESFGHFLAMEAVGSGASWKDSHDDHPLSRKLPRAELYAYVETEEDEDGEVFYEIKL